MRTIWKSLQRQIPDRVQINKKVFYEVCYIHEFPDGCLGETRYDQKQIVLKFGMSPKETVLTYWHEVLHAISWEHNVGLTETQVLNMEESGNYLFKPHNLFRPRRKS